MTKWRISHFVIEKLSQKSPRSQRFQRSSVHPLRSKFCPCSCSDWTEVKRTCFLCAGQLGTPLFARCLPNWTNNYGHLFSLITIKLDSPNCGPFCSKHFDYSLNTVFLFIRFCQKVCPQLLMNLHFVLHFIFRNKDILSLWDVEVQCSLSPGAPQVFDLSDGKNHVFSSHTGLQIEIDSGLAGIVISTLNRQACSVRCSSIVSFWNFVNRTMCPLSQQLI